METIIPEPRILEVNTEVSSLTPPSMEPTENGDAIDLVLSATEINKMSLEIQTNAVLARTHGKICLELALKAGAILTSTQVMGIIFKMDYHSHQV